MGGPWLGDVVFQVLDGQAGVVEVPSQTVQAILGCCTAGVANQVYPIASGPSVTPELGWGPLSESAAMLLQAGGVVLAVPMPVATPGAVNNAGVAVGAGILSSTNASPIAVTTTAPHGLANGAVVTIAGHLVNTDADGTWVATVTGPNSFTLNGSTGNGVGGATGTVTFDGTLFAGTGTAAPSFGGTPIDDYYPMVVAQIGFVVGTAGGTVLCSLDAGRTFGPPIPVGTSTTLALADAGGINTGLVLTLGTVGQTWAKGGIVNGKPVGDYVRASTTAPQPNDSGISGALGALIAYLAGTEGVFPIIQVVGRMAAADANAIDHAGANNLTTMAGQYLFERAIMSTRDVATPAAWGGLGAPETEAAWITSVLADFSATTARRVCATAGHYNMPSAIPTQFASTPVYRRPFSFALCAREVAIQPQTHAGKVGGNFGGALTQISVNPVTDPADGFVYHDERLTPAFDYLLPGGLGRLASCRTHARKAGFFAADPITLCPQGSDFTLLPQALVIDLACVAAYNALVNFVDADFTTNANGTLTDSAANTVKGAVSDSINSTLKSVGAISNAAVQVDQTQNIQITKKLIVTVQILGVAYILEIDTSIGFVTSLPAGLAA